MKPFHYNQDPLYAAAASILTGQPLNEEIIAFKNAGFKLLNGLMSDDEIHDAVNSTIKSNSQKLGDRTWDVVTDIYGKPKGGGNWSDQWILQRKGGGSWLTTKDGGAFRAHDSISSVLSFFEMEEEVKVDEGVEDIVAAVANFKKGDKTNFGVVTDISSTSISFKAKDLPVTKIVFNQRKMGSKDFVLDKLVKLKEGVEDFHSQKMIKNQLNTIVRNSTTCLTMIEAGREFPEWAQSEIAVAEAGIVSVTEFMESHQTALGEDSKLEEAVATPAVKKLIDGIDNLSPKEYLNFLQALSNHATDTSNAAQPVNGVSNGLAWYQVSKHIGAAAKAYSERPVKMNEAFKI
jgi:hypothetical protein